MVKDDKELEDTLELDEIQLEQEKLELQKKELELRQRKLAVLRQRKGGGIFNILYYGEITIVFPFFVDALKSLQK